MLITPGFAGWGVSAVREVGSPSTSSHSVGNQDGGREDEPGLWGENGERTGLIKIFCWGEVVGHVYLAMWVGSRRRVKGLGGVWKDGAGSVVIEME